MSEVSEATETLVKPPAPVGMNRRALALLGLSHLFDDVNQGAVPAMVPYFIAEFGLSYAAAAGLVMATTITSSVVQPILGQLSDRRPSPWLIPVGLFCAGGGLALATFMPTYILICLALGLCGLGAAAFHPEAARFASRVAGSRRATGMSLFSVGGNAGIALGPLVATPMMLAFGLRGSALVGVPAMVTALVLARLVGRFTPNMTGTSSRAAGTIPALGRDDWGAFGRLTAVVVVRSITYYGLTTFIPLYWVVVLHESPALGGAALSLLLVSGTVGTVLGGWLSDRYGRKLILLVGYGLLGPFLGIFVTLANPALALAMLVPTGVALYLPFSVSVVMGQEYLPSRIGTASGVTMGLAVSVGGLTAPLLGQIADQSGIASALTAVAFLPVLATVFAATLPVRRVRPAL